MPARKHRRPNPLIASLAGIPVWVVFAFALASAIDRGRIAPATVTVESRPTLPASLGAATSTKALPASSGTELSTVETGLALALPDAKAATVAIRSFHRREFSEAIGTGVIISKDGLVLTAGHVVDRPGAEVTVTLADGTEHKGEALGISLWSDAGMVQIHDVEDLPAVPVANAGHLPGIGDWAFALGHPGGLDDDRGVVLRVGRILEMDPFTIRTSCKLLGGDSGGPLFDMEGRVIGINSRISEDVDENYHVSLPAFHRRWAALADGRTLGESEGYLGVVTEAVSERLLIRRVMDDSAASGSLEVGDLCTHVNGVRVASSDLFRALVKEHSPGETVTLDILRDGEPRSVELKLGEDPR